MPLVRIDLRKGRDAAVRQDIGRVVYEAMVGVGVPEGDRFQIVAEHDADGFLFDPNYLGTPCPLRTKPNMGNISRLALPRYP
jgi:4-oxalocrotonate tautomerase